MGQRDSRVDEYIEQAAEFARPVLGHLRNLVHAACPQVEEALKWKCPHFSYKGMLCHMAAFKSHCAFGFWHGAVRELLDGEKSNEAMGQLGRITSLADLPKDAVLTRYIKQAAKLNEDGVKSPRNPKSPPKKLKMPDSMTNVLRKNKLALANFKAMSPSHQ
ncbi:MAG TPA: DUF1801 domain-containing protein, partial [Rhizomicrobium sp.]|nr:DUF1801 domain-containing protein [Rhizomicrobium sp.]